MKIKKSRRVMEQVALASGLRAELLRLIKRKMKRESSQAQSEAWVCLLRLVELSAPAFRVRTRSRPAKHLDRRSSMQTGPFYTSQAYPAPVGAAGNLLFPVLQLDLSFASAAGQQPLGDGLLQLWFDTCTAQEFVRVIPLSAAYADEPTEFSWPGFAEGYVPPLPGDWNLDPWGPAVQQIVELEAIGFDCQAGHIQAAYNDVAPDEPEWLETLLKLFYEKATCNPGRLSDSIQLFGSFDAVQYSAADVGWPCLMSMSWYASGGAQLFYQLRKGQAPQFSFWSYSR